MDIMKGMRRISIVLILLLALACQKKVPGPLPTPVLSPPDEPFQKLAWETVQRVRAGVTVNQLRLESVTARPEIPAGAAEYFRTALLNRLSQSGMIVRDDAAETLRGQLLKQNGALVFAFSITGPAGPVLSDSAGIPLDDRVQNTLAQFEPPIVQRSEQIPSPLAVLPERPLDVQPFCEDSGCSLLILYNDRLTLLNPQSTESRDFVFPASVFAPIRSRSASGKILLVDAEFLQRLALAVGTGSSRFCIVTSSQFISPLYFDEGWNGPVPFRCKGCPLPVAEPGVNTFILADGRFFDFEYLQKGGIAVIDDRNRLSLAEAGELVTATETVGGSLAVQLPYVYTSAPTRTGERDAILRFTLAGGTLNLDSSRTVDGEILDLALTDWNGDNRNELLTVLSTPAGITVEAFQP